MALLLKFGRTTQCRDRVLIPIQKDRLFLLEPILCKICQTIYCTLLHYLLIFIK